MTNVYIDPDWLYISTLLNELKWEQQGLHYKIAEVESLRYFEAPVAITAEEVKTGQRVRTGLTADLIENLKAAILAQKPVIRIVPYEDSDAARDCASNRERFWQCEIDNMMGNTGNMPNKISELADAQMVAVGVWKTSLVRDKWDPKERRRKRGESADDHVARVNALKKKQGLPIADLVVHPLAALFRPGEGSKVEEVIEHSYKPRKSVYAQYGIHAPGYLQYNSFKQMPGWKGISAMPGQPSDFIRPLPSGIDTTNYVLCTEYWNPDVYKVFINSQEVYKEYQPCVRYFLAPGRSSSSKDPDKYAMSVAENLRHTEPLLDRALTRMLEAAELVVNKRLTLEVPESYTPQYQTDLDGNQIPQQFQFNDDHADALPPGAKLVDAYEGAHNVYAAMPVVEFLIGLSAQQGVNPMIKGISPGAAGSGYRDNSLYLMARSLIQYVIGSLQGCLTDIISFKEDLVAYHLKQDVWLDNYQLKYKDIIRYPAKIQVILQPSLPQNLIAEGEFWERQRQAGNVSRRYHREHGLGLEQPDDMEDEVDEEQVKEDLKPLLRANVMRRVIGAPEAGSGLVDQQGRPLASDQLSQINAGAGVRTPGMGQNGAGRELAGRATGGQPKAPEASAGQFPPPNRENR